VCMVAKMIYAAPPCKSGNLWVRAEENRPDPC
jgi:hypothetical protein